MAELDAVEAAQVARRLGRRNDVVDGDRQLGARQRDRRRGVAPSFSYSRQRRVDGRAHAGRHALAEELLRHADAQAVERVARARARSPRPAVSSEVESRSGSGPHMADSSSAQSSAERAIGPAWSRLEAKATMP